MCADQIIHGGETYCKPCDVGSFDWDTMKCSASLASEGRAFNSYCQSNLLPPDGCECDDVYENPEIEGYVKADQVYFGRGSVSIFWIAFISSAFIVSSRYDFLPFLSIDSIVLEL